MELPPVLRLAVPNCGDRVLGGFDRIKALHEVRAVRENRKTREDVEMLLVVRRADEEKCRVASPSAAPKKIGRTLRRFASIAAR